MTGGTTILFGLTTPTIKLHKAEDGEYNLSDDWTEDLGLGAVRECVRSERYEVLVSCHTPSRDHVVMTANLIVDCSPALFVFVSMALCAHMAVISALRNVCVLCVLCCSYGVSSVTSRGCSA